MDRVLVASTEELRAWATQRLALGGGALAKAPLSGRGGAQGGSWGGWWFGFQGLGRGLQVGLGMFWHM